ncbi:MAG: hypothetical protein ACKVYV_16910 [Limisphaerales bacterium]
MRSLFVAGALAALALAAGCGRDPGSTAAPSEPLLRLRFVGSEAAVQAMEPGPLREVWTHDQTRALGGRLAARLAELAAPAFGSSPAALEPLAAEFLRRGGLAEWHDAAGQPRLAVALPGDAAAAQRWQSTLGAGGRVTATNGVLFIAPATGLPAGFMAAWARPAAPGALLTAELRGAELARRLGLERQFPFGAWPDFAAIRVTPRPTVLALAADLKPGTPLAGAAGEWALPVEVLRDPIISFSAARGVGEWLRGWLGSYGVALPEAPGQVFTWSFAGVPWQGFAAATLRDPAAALAAVPPGRLPGMLERMPLRNVAAGLSLTNAGPVLELRGLPWMAPFAEARTLASGSFVIAGLLPLPRSTNAPPAELLAQVLGRTNLVWYDWETTGTRAVFPAAEPGGAATTNFISRLDQLRQLRQLLVILDQPPKAVAAAPGMGIRLPGDAWVNAVAPLLGDSVTELVQAAPDRLELRRASRTGFNSLELMRLLAWLDPPPPPSAP